tara:strand:+ start:606 stop:1754 length:1149 start_codon:yes stop_codon:yes gene_type:complete
MYNGLKILCLPRSPLDYFGGIPIFCLNLYKKFNYPVTCFSYDLTKKINKPIYRNFLGIDEIVFPSEFNHGTISISIRYFFKIILNIQKFDILHIQHPDPFSAISVIFAKFRKPSLKIVTTWHAEVYKSYLLFSPILFLIDLILFSLSSKIIYFTPYHVKSSLLAKIPFFKRKIQLIQNTVDKEYITKFQKRDYQNLDIETKKSINLVSVGRLVSYKGYEYAIQAISKLDSRFFYRIVGKGPLLKKLQDLIEKYQLQNRVFLLGELSDKEKFKILDDSDIFLFPSISTSEAYGLSQIEAMCFNLPIINTELQNGVNFLVPREVAITCKIKSDIQLKDSILKLTNNNDFYKLKCEQSKKNLKRFSISKMIHEYENLFLSLFMIN